MQQDKVHPSSTTTTTTTKPPPPPPISTTATTATTAAPPPHPKPLKPPPYNYRPRHHPPPPPPRRRRRYCCLCFLYTLILFLSLCLLAAVAASVFYFIYHPKHPSFSLSSVLISNFTLTTASSAYPHINSILNLTLITKNPNTKPIEFLFNQIDVSAVSEVGIDLGNTTIPGFSSVHGNVTVLEGTVRSDGAKGQDPEAVGRLRAADLVGGGGKKKGWFPVTVVAETSVRVKVGKVRTRGVGIRVVCDGIKGFVPVPVVVLVGKGKKNGTKTTKTVAAPAPAGLAGVKCKVHLRIKIWKVTL